MSAPFKVGEVVIGQNFVYSPEYNGMECEVIGGLKVRGWKKFGSGCCGESPAYRVRWADGRETTQLPHELRRRKPPTEFTGEQILAQLIRDTLDKAPMREKEMA